MPGACALAFGAGCASASDAANEGAGATGVENVGAAGLTCSGTVGACGEIDCGDGFLTPWGSNTFDGSCSCVCPEASPQDPPPVPPECTTVAIVLDEAGPLSDGSGVAIASLGGGGLQTAGWQDRGNCTIALAPIDLLNMLGNALTCVNGTLGAVVGGAFIGIGIAGEGGSLVVTVSTLGTSSVITVPSFMVSAATAALGGAIVAMTQESRQQCAQSVSAALQRVLDIVAAEGVCSEGEYNNANDDVERYCHNRDENGRLVRANVGCGDWASGVRPPPAGAGGEVARRLDRNQRCVDARNARDRCFGLNDDGTPARDARHQEEYNQSVNLRDVCAAVRSKCP
jgi:hypothetical protein